MRCCPQALGCIRRQAVHCRCNQDEVPGSGDPNPTWMVSLDKDTHVEGRRPKDLERRPSVLAPWAQSTTSFSPWGCQPRSLTARLRVGCVSVFRPPPPTDTAEEPTCGSAQVSSGPEAPTETFQVVGEGLLAPDGSHGKHIKQGEDEAIQ